MPRHRTREGVVLVLEALPDRREHDAPVPSRFALVFGWTGMGAVAVVKYMPTNPIVAVCCLSCANPIVDAVCCLSCGGDCRHGALPRMQGRPRSKANDRLTLELN